jgi:uncharacterized protein (DUF302 family)
MKLGLTKRLTLNFEETITKVTEELKKEGFGILTTIDVQNTIKQKLDKDFRKYTILGACNPQFSHEALLTDDQLGLLMPCNVVVQEKEGKTEIAIFNPALLQSFTTDEKLNKMSEELAGRIKRVLNNL